MTILQTDLYYERMTSALGDKRQMLEYALPGRILDVGCGNGIMLDVIRELGSEAFGLDATAESVHRSAVHGHDVREGLAQHTATIFGNDFFDTILCSSVLHEVYSYGDAQHGILAYKAVDEALNSFKQALHPGGRLIIRDGVRPTATGRQRIYFTVDEVEEGIRLARKYLSMIPFHGTAERQVSLSEVMPGVLEGDPASVMEFLYTYTWGENAFPRETQELYGVYGLEDYEDYLDELGFDVIEARSYLQPGYRENLENRALVTDQNGSMLPFPDSNMLIVAQKR